MAGLKDPVEGAFDSTDNEGSNAIEFRRNEGKPVANTTRFGRETKGRKGKGVTIVSGLPLIEDDLKHMASKLKQLCGTGGTVKDGII